MSDVNNPYQSPQADIRPENSSIGGLSENMISYLRGASPWLRFMGILGFIGSGLMIVLGVVSVFAGGLSAANLFGSFDPLGILGGAASLLVGVMYGAGGVLAFIPARFTYNFGAKLRSYLQTNAEQDLELAFKNNKSLWMFNGILAIIGIAVVPVITVISIIVLVTSSSMFR